jgi:penicillin amidase
MALHGGPYDVAGMSLPGVPFIVAGHNNAIAWGFTNAMLDDVDLFLERRDPADSTRYLTPQGSEPFRVIRDSIVARGLDAPVHFDIRVTRHGPILETVEDPAGADLVALRWVAHEPSHTLEAIPALNRATGWDEFTGAVRKFDNPHQNIVYADTAGNFGYIMSGRVPLRGDGRRPPDTPVPGWTGEWDWNGWLPFEQHPQALNPATGYVVTANHRQVQGEIGDRISRRWEPPFRAERIRAMILDGGPFSAPDVHAMQLDVHDALAAHYRDLAVAAAEHAGHAENADTLRGWNLEAARDSRAAALFYLWYERLRLLVRSDLYTDRPGFMPRETFHAVLEGRALPWHNSEGEVAFDSLSARAAVEADSIANGRPWGDIHTVHAEHALAASALLDRVFRLNVGGLPAGGSSTTVNVSHYDASVIPIRASYGPSQRHVVDMADIDREGGFVLPTGQSGLPFSTHYRDQFPMWRSGGLWRIPLDRTHAAARMAHTLTLIPRTREANSTAR